MIGFRQRGFNNPPFLLAETLEADAGYRPSITLATPFPGGGAISPNPSLTAVQKNIRNSESYQWGGPAANISVPASVGRITSGGEARVIQFGLKLLF